MPNRRLHQICAISLISLASPVLGQPAVRPTFEYKGFRAGEIVPAERLATCQRARNAAAAASLAAKPAGSEQQMRNLFSNWQKLEASKAPPEPAWMADTDSCGSNDSRLAGVPVKVETITLFRNKLSGLLVMFDAVSFKTVTDALKAKYGAPCKVAVNQLQNRMGATFASPHYEWCFASGRLLADMYYPDIETSAVQYDDPASQPPKASPKVDF